MALQQTAAAAAEEERRRRRRRRRRRDEGGGGGGGGGGGRQQQSRDSSVGKFVLILQSGCRRDPTSPSKFYLSSRRTSSDSGVRCEIKISDQKIRSSFTCIVFVFLFLSLVLYIPSLPCSLSPTYKRERRERVQRNASLATFADIRDEKLGTSELRRQDDVRPSRPPARPLTFLVLDDTLSSPDDCVASCRM